MWCDEGGGMRGWEDERMLGWEVRYQWSGVGRVEVRDKMIYPDWMQSRDRQSGWCNLASEDQISAHLSRIKQTSTVPAKWSKGSDLVIYWSQCSCWQCSLFWPWLGWRWVVGYVVSWCRIFAFFLLLSLCLLSSLSLSIFQTATPVLWNILSLMIIPFHCGDKFFSGTGGAPPPTE